MKLGVHNFYILFHSGHRISLTRQPTARKRRAIRYDDEEMVVPKPLRDIFANDKKKGVNERMVVPKPLANIGRPFHEHKNNTEREVGRIILENDYDVRFYENGLLRQRFTFSIFLVRLLWCNSAWDTASKIRCEL